MSGRLTAISALLSRMWPVPALPLLIVVAVWVDFVRMQGVKSGVFQQSYWFLSAWAPRAGSGYVFTQNPRYVPVTIYGMPGTGLVARWDDDQTPLPDGAIAFRSVKYAAASRWRTGAWAMTEEHLGMWLSSQGPLSAAQVAQLPALIAPVLATGPRAAEFKTEQRLFASGVMGETRWLPWGFVHNAVVVLAVGWSLVALGQQLRSSRRRRRSANRRRLGLCPNCEYPVAAHSAGPCPECGWTSV